VLRQAIDADNRAPGLPVRLCLLCQVAEVRGNDDKTSRQIGPQLVQMRDLFRMIVVRIAQNQAIPTRKGDVFGAPHYGRKERVRNIGNDHPDHVRLDSPQSPRQLARLISDSVHSIKNAFSQRLANRDRVIEHVRDGTDRDTGLTRYIENIRHQPSPKLSPNRSRLNL